MVTEFDVNDALTKALAPCSDHYGCGDPTLYEWPNNVLAVNTVIYRDGTVARRGPKSIQRDVDPAELALCQRLATELHAFVARIHVGMKSEADTKWTPFFQVADAKALVPTVLDEASVRARFGGTIMPLDRVVVEPMSDSCSFWRDIVADEDEKTEACWRKLLAFVAGHEELHGACFVQVGFYEYGETVEFDGDEPEGYSMRGSCLPRLALAITSRGSVVGVMGHVVWT